MNKQITVVLVGAGNRARVYSDFSFLEPDQLKIVGIVDPDPVRAKYMKERYQVPEENVFGSVDEFVKREKFADAVINGTMDELHVQTSIPVLRKGYDLLLEKPFAVNEEELLELEKVAEEEGSKVLICHVLRYAPFYAAIKKELMTGRIGDIISIEMNEHVSYHHMAVSYVRGKWRSEKLCHAPMLLAKCCHDIDLMMWMMNHTRPVSVVSFGSDFQFLPEKKPEGAGSICMADCPYVKECRFSTDTNYISHPDRWTQYIWKCLEGEGETSLERKKESMRTDNPYGKCVWDYERDQNVDHQSVIVNFENNAVGTFTLSGGAAAPERNIHIVGTHGEIKGTFETSKFVVRIIDAVSEKGYVEKEYDLNITGDMTGAHGGHGGGDMRLVKDFVDYLNGEEPSISCTKLDDSTVSHRVVFKAEKSRKNGTIEKMEARIMKNENQAFDIIIEAGQS